MRVKTTAKLTRIIGGVYDFHTRQGITRIIDLVYMLTSKKAQKTGICIAQIIPKADIWAAYL